MDLGNMLELAVQKSRQMELTRVLSYNQKTEQFGLTLTPEMAGELVAARYDTLKKYGRVEFKKGILPDLILEFCDSDQIDQENYQATLQQLQDIFYAFKSESMDQMTDAELLHFMRKQFDGVCGGSTEYLATTCLERFSKAIRSGEISFEHGKSPDEYQMMDLEEDDYGEVSEETLWDRELYWEALKDQM